MYGIDFLGVSYMCVCIVQQSSAAEYLWTGGMKLRGREFCSLLNLVIRDDVYNEITFATPVGEHTS